ncbi:TetR/AcrR family transcriptional regulator [Amycolatopsis sp. FU40]|uniref:TetR/AcrR family transcriptional regulator n=1 Tax=Amycolatopsis sp. FU40 TaxID=2914159 RepID=UPI001F2951C4|nr:TetR/AcrR family transcriptional regulator [Amycolatopsis sp. FU40]UKD51622.1 TetR/AcrR family transcriptional regulator [Amycolatopsis sp. FU40]
MPARTGRPPKISRSDIVAAAHRVIDEDGVDALTMRRLAKEVGSTPMALYHHVRDKEGLLLLLLDDYAHGEMPRPENLPEEPCDRIVAVAKAMRDGLANCPWIVEVLRSDDLLSVGGLWYPEKIVAAAEKAGLPIEAAVEVYRAVWHYTLGEISSRAAAARRRDQGGDTHRQRVFADLDTTEFPTLAQIGPRWETLTAQDSYERSIRALVNGLLP